jgi:signal transduction histidine kinase
MSQGRSGRLALRLAGALTPVIGISLLVFGGLVTLREADLIEADLRLDAEAVAVTTAALVEATPAAVAEQRVADVDRRIPWLSIRLVALHAPDSAPPRALVDEVGPDGRARLVYTAPAASEGRPFLVVVSVPLAQRDAYILRSFGLDLLGIAVGTAFAGLIALAIGRALVARRVERVVQRLREVGSGGVDLPPLRLGGDELGAVGDAVNLLAIDLQQTRRRAEAEGEQRRLAQLHLRRADRLAAVGKMVSVFAHEIGTPLAVIAGRSERMLRRADLTLPSRADLDIVREQADRIAGFVRRLLDHARHDDRLELGRTGVEGPVQRAVRLVQDRVGRRVELVLRTPSIPWEVDGDPRALEQVFVNLLLNAAEASPVGASVEIEVVPAMCTAGSPELREVHLHVVVEDRGPGIAAPLKERVFDPFFTTRPAGEGTGLGLPIVKEIVQDHGGRVTLEDRDGGGLRVVVHLPLAPETEAGLGPSLPPEAG